MMEQYKQTPLWNNELLVEERLDFLIKELTLDEKIACLTTGCPDVERLGIKAFGMGGEAAHGIEARHDQAFNAGEPEPTTCFTQPVGMSSSFDRELIKSCGQAVGEEARAIYARHHKGGLCRWAPTVDMERDPRWGRTEEAYGEDPYLTGEMASSYIRGMEGEDPFYIRCGATLKHFYANNVEKDRIKISSSLDGRNKYEYYLEPFRKTIEEGKAEAVMTSYNEINGIPAIVNDEVQKLLKDTYGLTGHVVCDGGDMQQTVNDHHYFKTHAETIAYGLKAGVDCFTDDKDLVITSAREAYDLHLITEEDINRSVRNSFRTRIRLGQYDGQGTCPYSNIGEDSINNGEHQRLCAKMAEENVVLLKNDRDFLPLLPEKTSSMAVVGPLADVWYKDWYCGVPPYTISVLDGIKKVYPDTSINHKSGLSKIYLTCNGRYAGIDQDKRLFMTDREGAEVFTYTDWGFGSATLIADSNGMYVTLEEGSYLIKADKKEAFSWFIRESFAFMENPDGSFKINSWNGRKITIDQDGYLAVIKTNEAVPGEGDDSKLNRVSHACREGDAAVFNMEIAEDGIREAAEAAKTAETAVLVIGCNPVINSKEEIDRTTIELPPFQQKLADSILEVNPNTVVVLVSNYPYAINKIQKEAPGILLSASGSQELGTGIARILSGTASPAGRLPMTWYHSDEDLPDINDYDIIKGKRTYQYFDREVLYPFGYGLSYSSFSYTNLSAGKVMDGIEVKVCITNTGSRVSDEVVQLYIHREVSRVKQPLKQLKGFTRVKDITPGEIREITFMVKWDELRYYDVISQTMLLEEGYYTFMAGPSSRELQQRETVFVEGSTAGTRNPFEIIAADRYDSYENCFIHRGPDGFTCMIPGKAGDLPDYVDKHVNTKVLCELTYHDFKFNSLPKKFTARVYALEDSEIQVTMYEEDKEYAISIAVRQGAGFEEVSRDILPEQETIGKNVTVQIRVSGKCKLGYFQFLS